MGVSAALVKELRDKTGAGMMDCKTALTESNGDIEDAIVLLRKKGIADASRRAGRQTSEGIIGSYIHSGGKIGVIVEVNCESDFVGRNDEFQQFVKDLCLQVCSENPRYVSVDDVPADVIENEREIYIEQARSSGKPEKILDKIAEGKLRKFYETVCLTEQPFIREPKTKIKDLLKELISKLGENIVIRRFARFQVGEEAETRPGTDTQE